MDAIVWLRLIHIVCGVYWAGTLIFVATMLEPSVRAAGPAGGGVMAALIHRRFLTTTPIVAALTILSGIDLMRRVSAGFEAAWFSSSVGATLTTGAVAAVIAFIIGVGIMRPAALRVGQLAQKAPGATDAAAAEELQSAMAMLRQRSALAGRAVAALLTVTVAAMAVARYLG